MNYQQVIQDLIDGIEGAQAAVLMGLDGISVVEARKPRFDKVLADFSVECSNLMRLTMQLLKASEYGGLTELSFSTESFRGILHLINAEYFLLIVCDSSVILGKSRYRASRVLPELLQGL